MVRQVRSPLLMGASMSTRLFELVSAETVWRILVGTVFVSGRWFAGRVVPRGRRRGAGPRTT